MTEAVAAKSQKVKGGEQARKIAPELSRQPAPIGPYGQLLSLQRSVGNRAVNQLVQPKLAVNQPEDSLEQEANRVAEQIVAAHVYDSEISQHHPNPA